MSTGNPYLQPGTAFGSPTVQAVRSYKGWQAWADREASPTAILMGSPSKD